jgi:hypothetical protein
MLWPREVPVWGGLWWTRSPARRSRISRSCGRAPFLFAFDPWRSSILLVAGDKAGRWNEWYDEAIPLAEKRYGLYLQARAEEEGDEG